MKKVLDGTPQEAAFERHGALNLELVRKNGATEILALHYPDFLFVFVFKEEMDKIRYTSRSYTP